MTECKYCSKPATADWSPLQRYCDSRCSAKWHGQKQKPSAKKYVKPSFSARGAGEDVHAYRVNAIAESAPRKLIIPVED